MIEDPVDLSPPRRRTRRLAGLFVTAVVATSLIYGLVKSMDGSLPPRREVADYELIQSLGFVVPAGVNDPAFEHVEEHGYLRKLTIDSTKPEGVNLDRFLKTGKSYVLFIEGTYQWKADGALADAECFQASPESPFLPLSTPAIPADGLDASIRKTSNDPSPTFPQWLARTQKGALCDPANLYRFDYTPPGKPDFFNVFINDFTNVYTDNQGSLTLTVIDRDVVRDYACPKKVLSERGLSHGAMRLVTATVTVDTQGVVSENELARLQYWERTGHWGMETCNWAMPGTTYEIEASGVYTYNKPGYEALKNRTFDPANVERGDLFQADAECSTGPDKNDPVAPGASRWLENRIWGWEKRQSGLAPDMNAENPDWLDIWINDTEIDWQPMGATTNDGQCSLESRYQARIRVKNPAPLHFRIFEYSSGNYREYDNRGPIQLTITRV